MYNYFTLLDDLQEMMTLFKSLPVCTIIFNKNAEIIDMNQAASDFLKITYPMDGIVKRMKIEMDEQFYDITSRLKNGEIFSSVRFRFILTEHKSVIVRLNPSLFCGLKDLFVFQFSEDI